MPCVKRKPTLNAEHVYEEEISFENYVKELTEEDFLTYPRTRNYIVDQHFLDFDYKPREAVINLYNQLYDLAERYFPGVLALDRNIDGGSSLAVLIFNNINMKVDVKTFHECPELARGIDKYIEEVYDNGNVKKLVANDETQKQENPTRQFDWNTKEYKNI